MATITTEGPGQGFLGRLRDTRLGNLLILGVTVALVGAGAYLVQRSRGQDLSHAKLATSSIQSSTGQAAAGSQNVNAAAVPSGPTVGQKAQDFTVTTTTGRTVTLSEFAGHPVWLLFGASWCAGCRAEAPDVEAAYQRVKADGVVVLSISMNESTEAVKAYADRAGLTYLQAADPQEDLANAYQVIGVPAHIFIDRTGVVRVLKTGALGADGMDAALSEIKR